MPRKREEVKPNLLAEFIQEIASYFNEDTFLKMKRQLAEKTFAKHTSDKGLISRRYNEL